MSSTSRPDPRTRATWRWGGAIALLLVIQSLLLAGLFWLLATNSHQRAVERDFARDCATFSALPAQTRMSELRTMLFQDVHRDRFLALFDTRGERIEGNVARIPDGVTTGPSSTIAQVEPTELPGKTSDVARLALCRLPDGTRLLTGVDLDDAQEALHVVERSLAFGLIPGLVIAIAFGFVAGRRAARQVDAVRRLTARIVSGDLDERLPVGAKPDSFGLLCAHINAMLDRLQTLVADVRGVGDDIAHQLRTPLTRLRARIERGMREAEDNAGFEAVADAALAEIDKLLGIVAALLRIRELEDHARHSRFAAVDLRALVEDACDLHRPIAEDRGIAMVCEITPVPPIQGDASLLIEAVSNLIDNAMKFGPSGGTVRIALQQVDGCAAISVADDGPGVPRSEQALVTQRFYRGRYDCEGAGLGLSLVKAIAELHGFVLEFGNSPSIVTLRCYARD